MAKLLPADPAELSLAAPESTPQPAVRIHPVFALGQSVRHANGELYTVRLIHAEGIGLDHVANLVHPSALTPV